MGSKSTKAITIDAKNKVNSVEDDMSARMEMVFDLDLDRLPMPVAEHICIFLSCSDVINLSKTCRFWHRIISTNSVWKKMVAHRYGYQAVIKAEQDRLSSSKSSPLEGAAAAVTSEQSDVVSYKELYYALATETIHVLDLGITWLNDHYLIKEADENSKFGHVVHLQNVCWLHIKGKKQKMLPGKYKLGWRLKLKHVSISGNTEFTAEPEVGYGNSLIKSISENQWKKLEQNHGTGKWFVMEMGTFTVSKMCDVTLQVVNIKDPYWKSGLWWDYVELKFVQ